MYKHLLSSEEGTAATPHHEDPQKNPAGKAASILLLLLHQEVAGILYHCTYRKALKRIINIAQKIISCSLPCLEDLVSSRCLNRVACFLKDQSHPRHHLFIQLPIRKLNSDKH